ncbi:MAG: hypothetical protein JW955_22725 [Sedimentisphaerales bacterium]|nr:hypothetical protein [Sedimentisphaerales bacterium]
MTNHSAFLCMATLVLAAQARAQSDVWHDERRIARSVPAIAADHPGNVFVAGEAVTVRDLPEQAVRWQAVDDAGAIVAQGQADGTASANLGSLGIGWYRLNFYDASGKEAAWTTVGVLSRPVAPTPRDSPICVDSATSWFAKNDVPRQERFAYLASLAGVNWIRDRMSWGEIQPAPDTFVQNTTYDSAATLQARYGLKVLQVFHLTAGWAIDRQLDGERASGRFPRDLRHFYNFLKAMAQRYEGRVLAWEPWNEANIPMFGGHTIDEMCTLQKAAYLAFKAAKADLTVCWNVYAESGTPLHVQGVLDNEVWPYFETYNIHTYTKPDDYLKAFAPAREAACGRPIWLTECGIGLPWQTERPWSELSPEDERRQAQFIAQSYASSLFASVNRHFFFILGNFPENKIQFGVLRHDQTPRPGYVALAAVGRLLAGARPLGRLVLEQCPDARVYAFRAVPDGVERDILVAWANKAVEVSWPVALSPQAVHDYLGRSVEASLPISLTPSAFFIVLPKGEAERLVLRPPMSASAPRPGGACPVVLQLQMPQSATNLGQQAHVIPAGAATTLNLFAYNFSDDTVSGTVTVRQSPSNWQLTPASWTVSLDPMERKVLSVDVTIPAGSAADWIGLQGEFGSTGRPVLAFRLMVKGN